MKVQIQNLTKLFSNEESGEKINVLLGISTSFTNDKMNFILGPSGSGKTSLLNIIVGYSNPTVGTVEFDGIDNSEHISYLLQEPRDNVFIDKSLQENVEIMSAISNQDINWDVVSGYFKSLDLNVPLYRHAKDLSSGQLQRFAIILKLIQFPKVLMLDEPTSFLDMSNSLNMISFLSKFSAETGCLILIATHNREIVQDHNKFILYDGRISTGNLEEKINEYKEISNFHHNTDQNLVSGIIEFQLQVKNNTLSIPRNYVILLDWNQETKLRIEMEDKTYRVISALPPNVVLKVDEGGTAYITPKELKIADGSIRAILTLPQGIIEFKEVKK